MSVWKPEVNIWSLPFCSPHWLVMFVWILREDLLLVTENSGCHLGRLTGPWNSRICPSLFLTPSTNVSNMCHRAQILCPWWESKLGSACLLSKRFTHWAISPNPIFISHIPNLINSTIIILPAFQAILIIYFIFQDN